MLYWTTVTEGKMPNAAKTIEIFSLAQFFYSRTGASGIVVIGSRPSQLFEQFPKATKLYVVCGALQKARYKKQLLDKLPETEFVTLRLITESFLVDKILVCAR